jgi:Type II secretory pathway, component ExeA (predicted ATPase)
MYTQFYGFKERPFEITPDPDFLFLSESHREALAHMIYAARERKGFTVLTGEVGTGKTTLVQAFLSQLNGKVKTAYIFNPKLTSLDFLRYICEDFGLKEEKHSKGQYVAQLHNFLLEHYSRDEQVILIIDEAQSLPPALLEEVRLLTNLETPKSKLLQVILVGQPELNAVLNSHPFRQLKQRVSLRYHLQPLDEEDTKKYVEKRLASAGAIDTHIFTAKAMGKIYSNSRGIPRLINIISDNALLAGYSENKKIIGPKMIKEASQKMEGLPGPRKKKKNRVLIWIIFLVFIVALIMISFMVLPRINGISIRF